MFLRLLGCRSALQMSDDARAVSEATHWRRAVVLWIVCLTLAASNVTVFAAGKTADSETVVYVTPNPSLYHRWECRRLSRPKEITLGEAASRYTPCSHCLPPVLGQVLAVKAAAGASRDSGVQTASPAGPSAAATAPELKAKPQAAQTEEKRPTSTPGSVEPRKSSGDKPSRGRVVFSLLGAGIGFTGGALMGFSRYDDAIDSEAKITTLAVSLAVLGGAIGFLIGNERDSRRYKNETARNIIQAQTERAYRVARSALNTPRDDAQIGTP